MCERAAPGQLPEAADGADDSAAPGCSRTGDGPRLHMALRRGRQSGVHRAQHAAELVERRAQARQAAGTAGGYRRYSAKIAAELVQGRRVGVWEGCDLCLFELPSHLAARGSPAALKPGLDATAACINLAQRKVQTSPDQPAPSTKLLRS